MGNTLGFSGGYTPIDVGSVGYSMGVPDIAPIGASAPTTQAATASVVNTQQSQVAPVVPGTNPSNTQAPQINPITGELLNPSFLQKGGMLDIGLGALQTLGNLWNSFQQVKLAKEQFSFQKEAYSTNLANQEQAYNTSLENRSRTAGTYNGTDTATTDQYIKDHSL